MADPNQKVVLPNLTNHRPLATKAVRSGKVEIIAMKDHRLHLRQNKMDLWFWFCLFARVLDIQSLALLYS